MIQKILKKFCVCTLAVLMVFQTVGLQGTYYVSAVETETVKDVTPELQDGIAFIPTGTSPEEVNQILAKALIKNWEDVDVSSIEFEYYCTGKNGLLTNDAWGPIEGFTSEKKVVFVPTTFTHPALADNSDGDYQVRIAGTEEVVVKLTKKSKQDSEIKVNEGVSIALPYDDELNVNYDLLRESIFNKVVSQTVPENLTVNDVSIQYYATATTGAVGNLGKEWVDLEGGKVNLLTYPAINAGTHQIRISYAENDEYKGCSVETEIEVTDRPELQWNLKDIESDVYVVSMQYNDNLGYDYQAIEKAIIETTIASTVPEVDFNEIQVKYNADSTGLTKNWQPLDYSATWPAKSFGYGDWDIRLSWDGNKEYRGSSQDIKIRMTDSRQESLVVLKDNATFTYNMDAQVMKQAIIDQVIDYEQSILPENVSVDDFTIKYYAAPSEITGDLIRNWVDIQGETILFVPYPMMGAGEQQIRVQYKGNSEYRESSQVEANVTVQKANAKINVHSTNIFADEKPSADFITTNPNDNIDIFTIYAGITSNVTTSIYVDMPDKYTENQILKLLDPVIEKIFGKTFTQMMNDGMTIGELRQLLSTEELLEVLDKLNIDTGAFGQILNIINNLPSIVDSVRVSFGTPQQAGLYTVIAVSDSQNYNTAVGVGALLVKMRSTGVKLSWNQDITNDKMTVEEAKDFDFDATLTYNGEKVSQDSVHYLYTGLTNKFRLYSSTTTPPTEAGSYVVTVVTLGGNYQAAPITRTFRITK